MNFRIGSGVNAFARRQAKWVCTALETQGFGTRCEAAPVHETAIASLRSGILDLAVIPATGIPFPLPADIELIACLQRREVRDTLLSLTEEVDPENQNQAYRLGVTSSLAKAFATRYLPAWKSETLKTDLGAAVGQITAGGLDAILAPEAELKSLGIQGMYFRKMNPSAFSPLPGQGIALVLGKVGMKYAGELKALLHHPATLAELLCEKAFESKISEYSEKPVFALATVIGEKLSFSCGLVNEHGAEIFRDENTGQTNRPQATGYESAEKIIQNSGYARG